MEPVFVFGAAHWDLLAQPARTPLPGADLQGRIVQRPGGVALNIAAGLARAGMACELVAAIGRDAEGETLVSLIETLGVGSHYMRRTRFTDRYVAIERPDGQLFGAVADCRALEAVGMGLFDLPQHPGPAGQPPRATLSVLDGNLAPQIAGRIADYPALCDRVALVSASPSKAPQLRCLVERLAQLPSIRDLTLFVNLLEAEAICGARFSDSLAAARALCAWTAQAVVTDGPRPAALATAAGLSHTAQPTATIARSTLGAGDSFAAGFLAARLTGTADAEAWFLAGFAAAARQ
ncbi:MAG: PfkB family carbohydrate kinase, partial [Pseudomonadota bacterium]